jgi:monoamine oxidase
MIEDSVRRDAGSLLTRRQVLQWFGAVGGSSLVLGTMSAWELRAQPLGPRPVLAGRPQGTRVVILGAGVSGLVVGYELNKLGYDYQILEARDRVGGLSWSVKRGMGHTELGPGGEAQVCDFDEGQYFNAGPWRLPNDHHGILGYARELGVLLEPFNDANEVMFSEDPALGSLANRKIHLRELNSDLWGHTSELLAKALNRGSLDDLLSPEDKDLLLQFLVSAGYLDSTERVYRPNAGARGSEDAYDLGVLLRSPFWNQVRAVNTGGSRPIPVLQPVGGMMEIPLAFQRFHGSRIALNAKVVSIRSLEDDVRVVWENSRTGQRQEVVADYVVCCLPMNITKQLDVNFSPDMAAAVQASGHSSSSKMGFQMARRFWEQDDGIYGGHLQYRSYDPQAPGGGGNPLPSFSYPSNGYGSQKGVLLGFYGGPNVPGVDGVPLIDAPIRMRFEHVLTHASKVHPQMRDEFETAYAVMWPRVPFSEGAWASPAWQEGAVESAWRTVQSLHERVMQSQ